MLWAVFVPQGDRMTQDTSRHCPEKCLDRYAGEFVYCHNDRLRDTIGEMAGMLEGMIGNRLCSRDLIV